MTSAGAAVTESAIREWLRRRQLAYCPACIIAGLQPEIEDISRVRAAVAALARRPAFAHGYCLCGAKGVRYQSLAEPQ